MQSLKKAASVNVAMHSILTYPSWRQVENWCGFHGKPHRLMILTDAVFHKNGINFCLSNPVKDLISK